MHHEELDDIEQNGRPLMPEDNAAPVDFNRPAFLTKPEGAPVYYGFPLVPETMTDGWCFGAITEYLDPDGCHDGDGYVVAPDGSRAGLVWDVGHGELTEISPPEEGRWGIYQIWFPQPIRTTDDLVAAFRDVLPQLQKAYLRKYR